MAVVGRVGRGCEYVTYTHRGQGCGRKPRHHGNTNTARAPLGLADRLVTVATQSVPAPARSGRCALRGRPGTDTGSSA
eukprot:5925953-Prymnesium_polylepis.1